MYQLILLAHIVGSTTLIGGVVLLQFLAMRASRSPAADDLLTLSKQSGWVGPRVFFPASVLIAVSGVGLVHELQYDFGQPFIIAGAVVLGMTSAAGPLYLAPTSKTISRLITANGPDCPEVKRRLRRLFVISRVESVLLLGAMAGMVLQPA